MIARADLLDNAARISEHDRMREPLQVFLAVVAALGIGCRRDGEAPIMPPGGPKEALPPVVLGRPEARPDPWDQRGDFAFEAVTFPEVVSRLSRDHKLYITVSPSIPTAEWSALRVSLRMNNVSRRAFLDWLVRPLQARYALEGDSSVWLTRGDEPPDDEPLETRTYRVPTHLVSERPLPGILVYEREQAAVVDTLHACLRYIEERRPGCRIAFHGGQDVLAARLPPRGHARLVAVLDAMRYGSPLPELPSPSALELKTQLETPFVWDGPPGPANHVLFRIAEITKTNLGWPAAALLASHVTVPAGKQTLGQMLDAVVKQTPLGRYELEPGHGIWLYMKGQDANFPPSGATAWDRAVVRAFDVRAILPHLTPEALLAHLRKQVDPQDWGRGLPAAAVFVPTARLIVVHDDPGQRRVAAVVRELNMRYQNLPVPSKAPK